MNKTTYRKGVPGVNWGIYDKVNNRFVSGISEDSPMLAEARLFFIIDNAAKAQHYEPRMLPQKRIEAAPKKILATLADEEVKKALAYCSDPNNTCEKCVLYVADDDNCECASKLRLKALDLINRQQAKIELLKKANSFKRNQIDGLTKLLKRADEIKAEAIKEFAEELIKRLYLKGDMVEEIDNLVKEMVGDAE